MSQRCWVLTRLLIWHLLEQDARDPRGLVGRPLLCGGRTPPDRLDVLAFTECDPSPQWHLPKCMACLAVAKSDPQLRRGPESDTLIEQLSNELAGVQARRHLIAEAHRLMAASVTP